MHEQVLTRSLQLSSISLNKTSKTGLQRPAARYDGIGKIGGGYGFLVSMVPWGGWGGWGFPGHLGLVSVVWSGWFSGKS